MLGRDVVYRRRRPEAACYTEDDLRTLVRYERCPCTARDYECDFGFERTVTTDKCVAEQGALSLVQALLEAACNTSASVNVSSGYRKLPGDICLHDVPEYAPVERTCESLGYWGTKETTTILNRPPPPLLLPLTSARALASAGGPPLRRPRARALAGRWYRRCVCAAL